MEQVANFGSYKVVDPMRNFRVGIKFGRVTMDLKTNDTPLVYDEDVTIQWQEKLFSATERVFYINAANCKTEKQMAYHKQLSVSSSKNRQNSRIFTYIEEDTFSQKIDSPFDDGIHACSYPSRLLKYRKLDLIPDNLTKHGTNPFSLVVEQPSDGQMAIQHLPVKLARTMHIMADLSENVPEILEPGIDIVKDITNVEEVILCTITLDSNGVLNILPDFSQQSRPYKIENPKTHNVFQYEIVHRSLDISEIDQEKERKLVMEILLREKSRQSMIIGNQFEMPEQQTFRLFLVGEILSAKMFEYSGLYVQYFLELPQNWRTYDHRLLQGSTQVSNVRCFNDEEVSLFAHPIEFDLAYKAELQTDPKLPNAFKWPVLFFEVMSLDFWTRTRTEGYGYLELPRTAGEHVIEVQCWRPVGESVVDELRRFFVGGSCQLEDITYTGIPGNFEGKHLIKYGFRTQSTGTVTFRLNCAVQSWTNLHRHVTKHSIKATDLQKRVALSHLDVASVIRAYQRARRRLLETRQVVEKLSKTHLD